ncbi:Predicted membrane protein [Plasmopara halstedii]|uniref:Protein YIF1 n=1 Tax=Plasmopara halstedii TaxID=4781 RepID=A0A0P1AQ40_PLAHL|nr:Predicted membrane protein [Plasmopara halstedii]CEG43588.1 Predicted membrane protein [Plasmopara halstedii]|eukprot:XP_024579957.1 Predicted membrane protein [Plasmopara halstedii]
MAQPGSFYNPNDHQRPTQHYAAPAAPQFPAQSGMGQQRMPQRGPAHQFYQKPTATTTPGTDGYLNPQAPPSYPQDFHQSGMNAVPLAQPQYQQTPANFQPHHQNNFGDYVSNVPLQTPPNSNPRAHMHHRQQPDFIDQFSSNPMAGLAMNSAQDFLQKQSEMYLPGAYGVWGNLKYYFTVNNSYVKSRLKMLLLPFRHKTWRRFGNGEQDDSKPMQYAPPTRDSNAPDLYIPLMGFLTYILIVGYSKGTSNQFSPDVITKDASYCLVMQLIEIGVLAACLYVLNSSISFLDLVSFSGYKYIPLVINAVVYQLLGSIAYYVSLLYTGVAVSYFTLNCMKGSVAEPTPENRLFRNYLLFGASCLQLILVCWISYTTAPGE